MYGNKTFHKLEFSKLSKFKRFWFSSLNRNQSKIGNYLQRFRKQSYNFLYLRRSFQKSQIHHISHNRFIGIPTMGRFGPGVILVPFKFKFYRILIKIYKEFICYLKLKISFDVFRSFFMFNIQKATKIRKVGRFG